MKYAAHSPVVIAVILAETEAMRIVTAKSGRKRSASSAAPTKMDAAQLVTEAHRRKP